MLSAYRRAVVGEEAVGIAEEYLSARSNFEHAINRVPVTGR